MAAATYDWSLETAWTRRAKRKQLELIEAAEAVADLEQESLAAIREMIDRRELRLAALSLGDLPAVSWR